MLNYKKIDGYEYNSLRYFNNDPIKVILKPNDLIYNLGQIRNPDNHVDRNIKNFPNVIFVCGKCYVRLYPRPHPIYQIDLCCMNCRLPYYSHLWI